MLGTTEDLVLGRACRLKMLILGVKEV